MRVATERAAQSEADKKKAQEAKVEKTTPAPKEEKKTQDAQPKTDKKVEEAKPATEKK